MASYHSARYLEDWHSLDGCQLILLGNDALETPAFALTCRHDEHRMLAVLRNDFPESGIVGPSVDSYIGNCVAYGSDFILGFDPASIRLPAEPATVGKLVVCDDGIFLVGHRPSNEFSSGGRCFIDLSSGEIGLPRRGGVVDRWSISVDSWCNGKPVTVFKCPADE